MIMKNIKILSLAFILAFLFAACTGNSSKEKEEKLFPLVKNETAENIHFQFEVSDKGETDSTLVYRAISLYDEDTVGLEIEIMKHLGAGVSVEGHAAETGFNIGTLRFRSLGTESDRLVEAITDLYDMQPETKMTSETIEPMVFNSINQDVELPKDGTYSFKLFFEPDNEEPAEFFAVLDTHKSTFVLSEKDPAFRRVFVYALTK